MVLCSTILTLWELLTTAGIPLVTAMIHAAASLGQILDGFPNGFCVPLVLKGPSIAGKRVILLWMHGCRKVLCAKLLPLLLTSRQIG